MKFVVAELGVDIEIVHNVRPVVALDRVFDIFAHLTLRNGKSACKRSVVSLRGKARDVISVVRLEILRVERKDFVELLLFDLRACLNRHIFKGHIFVAADVVPVYVRWIPCSPRGPTGMVTSSELQEANIDTPMSAMINDLK